EIIFANAEGNNLVYSTFNIETGEMAEKLKVETNVEFVSMWDFEGNIIDDRKVYTLINNEYESSATLVVIDIDTNELLYQGTIEGDSQRRISKDESQEYFHTLEENYVYTGVYGTSGLIFFVNENAKLRGNRLMKRKDHYLN